MKRLLLIIILIPWLKANAEQQDNQAAWQETATKNDSATVQILNVLEKQFIHFRNQAEHLNNTAEQFCLTGENKDNIIAAYQATYLAWAPLDSYQFGPMEHTGAALSINFWPDSKNFVGRGLKQLFSMRDIDLSQADTISDFSAAAQGLPAVERLLYEDYTPCPALIGISAHLAKMANALYANWFEKEGWASLALSAGEDNPVYLSQQEFIGEVYSALDFGLIRTIDQRLGRPLGTFERSFPRKTEAWRSKLSNAIIKAQLTGLHQMIDEGFANIISDAKRAHLVKVINQNINSVDALNKPIFALLESPTERIRVEGLTSKLRFLQSEMQNTLSAELSLQSGFSPADGD